MPIGMRRNLRNEEVQYYYYAMVQGSLPSPRDGASPLILDIKKAAATEVDEYSRYQKEASKAKDYELAKYWSQMKSEAQKLYKAACFVAPWYCDDPLPGDCKRVVVQHDWPCELDEQLTSILNRISLL